MDDIRVISIASFLEGINYTWVAARGWSWEDARHMTDPPQWRKNLTGWTLHPTRLALKVGESGRTDAATGGFEAYHVVRGGGVTAFQVPDLNFHPVILTRPDGWYQKYFNIELVEPDPALFRPPPGAAVTARQPPPPPTRP
jgi:hypothetical protein